MTDGLTISSVQKQRFMRSWQRLKRKGYIDAAKTAYHRFKNYEQLLQKLCKEARGTHFKTRIGEAPGMKTRWEVPKEILGRSNKKKGYQMFFVKAPYMGKKT